MNALTPQAATPAQGLRDVRRGVAEAADTHVLQVVRMVDALEERGAIDEVLAPVRPRLRAIQPARPLRFARLLFLPADPLIVAPLAWRPGTPSIPRTAVPVLAEAVRGLLRAQPAGAATLAAVDGLIKGATTAQASVVRQAGALLWPHAASLLAAAAAQPLPEAWAQGWAACSLPGHELAPLARALAGVLGTALPLHNHDHSGLRLADAALAELLAGGQPLGRRALEMVLTLLVIRVPEASASLLATAQHNSQLRKLAEAAGESALTWLEAETGAQVDTVPPGAAAELNRQASLLETLAGQLTDAPQRRRLGQARASLLAGSLHRFETALHDKLATPLAALPAEAHARDAALDAMEAQARTLRAFEVEARRLGGGAKFDGFIQQIERATRDAAGLSPMDRARLAEIIAGPDAALRMLAVG